MDPSSSNSEYQDHHGVGIQQRDWLSCSTSAGNSSQMEVRDVTIEDGDDDNKERRRVIVEREHMFDKVVTPSDVGKLNRLVIPKQHAEKYFPLDSTTTTSAAAAAATNNSSGNNDNNNNNKAGLLLNFEDRTGKSWRFRYSYWNSSQSYVMTKGWSRFVKEKQLSAGDIVSFQRAVGDDIHSKNTFFIDWRRRPPDHHHHHHHHLGTAFSVHHSIPTWGGGGGGGGGNTSSATPTLFLRSHPHESHPHPHHNHNALWDHSNFCNNNSNNVTHLSPMNGNIMSMVPYAYATGSASGPLNNPSAGSLILLRSPVPNSASLIPHLMPPSSSSSSSSSSHHLNYPSLFTTSTSNNDAFQRPPFQNGMPPPKVYDSVPLVHGKPPVPSSLGGARTAKRSLRLFGVNMEYDNNNNNHHHHHHHELDGSPSTSSSNYDA